MDSEESETDKETTSSEEESEEDEKPAKMSAKKVQPKKKNVIESESEETEEEDSKEIKKKTENESEDTEGTDHESEHESGDWEEIDIETGAAKPKEEATPDEGVSTEDSEKAVVSKAKKGKRTKVDDTSMEKKSEAKKKKVESSSEEVPDVGSGPETYNAGELKKDEVSKGDDTVNSEQEKVPNKPEKVSPKKPRGRKAKTESVEVETAIPETFPKKRGRKPKLSVEAEETGQETQGEEIPVKKKRGRKPASVDQKTASKSNDGANKKNDSEIKDETTNVEENKPNEDENDDSKSATDDSSAVFEKGKEDSPLSARNKQNAPVGVVKPEVRQGVIVENKHAIEGRLDEQRSGEPAVNPLQGMRDLAMGSQAMAGQSQSSFTPYSQSAYGSGNLPPPYMNQPSYQNYPGPHFGPESHGQRGPYPGPPPPHYPPNQGPQAPMSPNSYQQPGSFMSSMQQGPPPGYYQQGFRPQIEGYGPHGQQPYQQGPYPPGYAQGPYPGPRPGYGSQMGPYPMGPHGHVPQGGPYQQGMPYNYPHMPPPGYGPQPSSLGAPSPIRPQSRLPLPATTQHGSSPTSRSEGGSEGGNRGFMMDNILKPSNDTSTNDAEDGEEVSDIDRYTSFLCKDK